MYNDENPMVVGVDEAYAKTFKDDPEETVICPHCGAVWEKYVSHLDPLHADWQTDDCKYAFSSTNGDKQPLANGFCYACALESATVDMLREYCDKSDRKAFAGWLVDMYDVYDYLTNKSVNAILGYYRRTMISKDMEQFYRDFISDNADFFREWRTFERGV